MMAPKPLVPGEALSVGDGLGNGFVGAGPLGCAEGRAEGEGVGVGRGALAAAVPPKVPDVAAASAMSPAAAMPAAFVNDQAFFADFFAMRDFCRAALFLWMMPRAAALSSADEAVFTVWTSAVSAPAFLTRVFNFVFADKLRLRRFSEARVHLIAALILGTKCSLIALAKIHEIIPYLHTSKQGGAGLSGEIIVKRGTKA